MRARNFVMSSLLMAGAVAAVDEDSIVAGVVP